MAELKLESGILGIRGPAFCFPFADTHLMRFLVFSAPASGVGFTPTSRGTPQGTHGTLLGGKIWEPRQESGILGIPPPASCLPGVAPVYCGFAYLDTPRLLLGVNVHPRESRADPRGDLRVGKIAELAPVRPRNATERQNGGITTMGRILGVRGAVFGAPFFISPSTAVSGI